MGRTSLADERRPQVLQAFARCVARAGFAGTSLEDVATEAGLARGHVRHYLGNRRDQVVALCDWVTGRDGAELDDLLTSTDEAERLEPMLEYLFDPTFYEDTVDNRVFLALFEEASRDDDLRARLLATYHDLLKPLERTLALEPSGLSRADASALAYLLVCAAVGNAHMAHMGVDARRSAGLGRFARRVVRDVLAVGSARRTTAPRVTARRSIENAPGTQTLADVEPAVTR